MTTRSASVAILVLALVCAGSRSTSGAAEAAAEPPTTGPQRVGPIYVEGRTPSAGPGTGPIILKPGPQLLVDDYLIESTRNLRRRAITLARDPAIPNPIVTGVRPDGDGGDKNFQPWVTVLRDPQSRRFRIWYDIGINSSTSRIGYLESDDGVHWKRPHRELPKPDAINFCSAVIDEGPEFRPSAERFKMTFYSRQQKAEIWSSPDGLEWTFFAPGPAPTNDIINFARDTIRNRYLMTHGAPAVPADGYKGSTPNAKEGYRRLVGQSISTDCRDWTPPRRIIMPGEVDEGITEFYGVGGLLCRGGLLIGTLKVLRDDLPCDPDGPAHGIGYSMIAWTRDGENWVREKEPLLDRDHTPQSWDHAHAWIDCQLPVGEDVYLYYGGYKQGHKINRFEERQIGLVRMKRDRYVAREAEGEGGLLRTPPLILQAKQLMVNVEPSAGGGELRAQLLGADERPIEGFSFDDCQPITADQVAAPLQWKGNLADVAEKPARLEFSLKRARLYAFELQ
jgi:hypothetical protein